MPIKSTNIVKIFQYNEVLLIKLLIGLTKINWNNFKIITIIIILKGQLTSLIHFFLNYQRFLFPVFFIFF